MGHVIVLRKLFFCIGVCFGMMIIRLLDFVVILMVPRPWASKSNVIISDTLGVIPYKTVMTADFGPHPRPFKMDKCFIIIPL